MMIDISHIPANELSTFLQDVGLMRAYQLRYFAHRQQSDLFQAKNFEKAVDRSLERFQSCGDGLPLDIITISGAEFEV